MMRIILCVREPIQLIRINSVRINLITIWIKQRLGVSNDCRFVALGIRPNPNRKIRPKHNPNPNPSWVGDQDGEKLTRIGLSINKETINNPHKIGHFNTRYSIPKKVALTTLTILTTPNRIVEQTSQSKYSPQLRMYSSPSH